MTIASLGLRARLGLSFGTLLLMLVGMAVVGIVGMLQLREVVDRIVQVDNEKLAAAGAIREAAMQQHVEMLRLQTVVGIRARKAQLQRVADQTGQLDAAEQHFRGLLEKSGTTPEQDSALAAVAGQRATAAQSLARLPDAVKATAVRSESQAIFAQAEDSLQALAGSAQALAGVVQRITDASAQGAGASFALGRNLILGGALVAFLLGGLIALRVARSLLRQLGGEPDYAVSVVRNVASGDLATGMDTAGADAASLLAAMSEMRERLSEVVAGVRAGMDEVTLGAHQVAHGNADLSNRTQAQASSLEEVAATMEQLTGTVRQNADNAREASALAQACGSHATQGSNVVARAVAAMEQLSASSRRIADITGVIDGIAFQTNLLALNAAVEAARAGETGRGFAVVAAEVRTLASRSAGAAREIKALIQESATRVEEGARLVNESGEALGEIVHSVNGVIEVIAGIATASREQAAGIDQVQQAVTNLDDITQQNAALVEQSAAASATISEEARRLGDLLGFFRLAA